MTLLTDTKKYPKGNLRRCPQAPAKNGIANEVYWEFCSEQQAAPKERKYGNWIEINEPAAEVYHYTTDFCVIL